jgi:aminoglycoside phosphotransferase (APT) family kinase protein
MHADELHTDVPLVQELLAAQFPEWEALPIERVPSSGTDNALYRLGDDMVVRLPRIQWATAGVAKDFRWLPLLAPLLPVATPTPLARGKPAEGYPWEWGVYRWLEGETPTAGDVADPERLAADLVRLLRSFWRIDLPDPPRSRRGAPLVSQDDQTRAALVELDGMIDTEAAAAAWDTALRAPDWSGPPVWLHGDLLPGNLLLRDGRLSGVIDFAIVGVGDPACDLIGAWALLPGETRDRLRGELDVDEDTWARGRGWALSIALVALPYYKDTNPGFAATARHLIGEVLAER